jgi:hypothetical protein
MDISKMLAELKAEREGVEQAIVVHRGKPPGSKNKPKDR